MKSPYKSKKSNNGKLKVFEAFAGYGGASFALKRAKIPYQAIGYSEFDKFAQWFLDNLELQSFLPWVCFTLNCYLV